VEQKLAPINIENQSIDYITAMLKGVAGVTPIAGGLLAELIGTVIPNQRIDRMAKFLKALEAKINNLEVDYVKAQLNREDFADLLEEAARQATHSLSDERRGYIANIIANSLSLHEIECIESKQLLGMLNELNDIEIIWLRYYLPRYSQGDEEFRNAHEEILAPIHMTNSDPPSNIEKLALQRSYKEHLSRLNLINPRYSTDSKTKLPEYDKSSGRQILKSYEITSLGKLLLKHIGLSAPN